MFGDRLRNFEDYFVNRAPSNTEHVRNRPVLDVGRHPPKCDRHSLLHWQWAPHACCVLAQEVSQAIADELKEASKFMFRPIF